MKPGTYTMPVSPRENDRIPATSMVVFTDSGSTCRKGCAASAAQPW